MAPSRISQRIAAAQVARGAAVLAAIILFAGAGEAGAQSPMLPHYPGLLLPVDRGPLVATGPAAPNARPVTPEQTCAPGDCGSPSPRPPSTSLPGARVAAASSATASSAGCDPGTAGGGARPAGYMPRHAEIALTRRHGTFLVRGMVNNCLTFEFHLDSGAADVTLSRAQFEQLQAARAVFPAEIAGQDTYVMADGRTATQEIFLIRSLQLGPMTVRNVRAAVMPGNAPPLLGMSFLGRFHAWSVNNHREVLSLNFGSLPENRP
jgi:clan AA aspartic protease (TIGR02281 family)